MKTENKILLADVNEFITCVLCRGYLIDATTITECLHTFCKKCIVDYLEENTNCPICDTLLHQSHPLLFISHDRTLQSIVYKLVGNLERTEIDRQCEFYTSNNLEYPALLKEDIEKTNEKRKISAKNEAIEGTENDPEKAETVEKTKDQEEKKEAEAELQRKKNDPEAYHRRDEPIALCLEPMEGLSSIKRKFIVCSCHSTITHLKKYIAQTVYAPTGNAEGTYKELDVICNDEILGKDHTLKFILVTKWKDREQPMRLNFRPKLVF